MYSRKSRQVTPTGARVIDVTVSCWLTSWLHTLEEGMRYRWGLPMWGNHSQPGHTSFHGPRPLRSPHGLPSAYTPHRLKRANGRAPLGDNCEPPVSLQWAQSFCFRVWWLMQRSAGLDPPSTATSAWPLRADMEGLQARELPVASICHSVRAGAWSRWYEQLVPSFFTSLFFWLFLRITSFEKHSRCKTQVNNMLDVHITKSKWRSYVL